MTGYTTKGGTSHSRKVKAYHNRADCRRLRGAPTKARELAVVVAAGWPECPACQITVDKEVP